MSWNSYGSDHELVTHENAHGGYRILIANASNSEKGDENNMVTIGTVPIPSEDTTAPDDLTTQILKEASRLNGHDWVEYTDAKNKIEPPHICDGRDHIIYEKRKLAVIQQNADIIYACAKLLESLGVDDITEFIARSYERNEKAIALDKAKETE